MAAEWTLKEWVDNWKRLTPILEEIRNREIVETDTAQSILLLEDAFQMALRENPPPPTSGMVEMQAWFRKLRP